MEMEYYNSPDLYPEYYSDSEYYNPEFLSFMRESGYDPYTLEDYKNYPDKYQKAFDIYKNEVGVPTIIIARPMKKSDPTEFTYQWGQKAVDMARNMGYNVIDIQKDDCTYENVTKIIKESGARLFVAFSHGCVSSIQGQNECMVTRKYGDEEILHLIENGDSHKLEMIRKMIDPIGELSCPGICKLNEEEDVICNPVCAKETNINELKGSIVIANACWTGHDPGLGKCAERYGVQSYTGYDSLFMFATDTLGSQDIFGNIQLTMFKELLLGKTVGEAEEAMIKFEDDLIRKYKHVKYIALPILYNKVHRKIFGDKDAMLYMVT